ncbi:hypothetical protein QYE76_002212 [Lolium multiflorum]|uniref:XS domain-containing protein n=1 Tax=Lolium multiflorum TaxID=4521 RepID=A0AAD8RP92_LOLMU|nr:hypothetical protein QYE76_002212 [Lolium multiflorum]
MDILANVPVEQTEIGGATLMQQLADFRPPCFNVAHCIKGYIGFAVVRFEKDWIGFKDAYKSRHLGEVDWNQVDRHGKCIFCWLARDEDYNANDPVCRFLSDNGELKTMFGLQLERLED